MIVALIVSRIVTKQPRVRGIWFLIIEIKCPLVYNSTIFKLMDFFVSYFSLKTYMPAKKYIRKKAKKLYVIGQIVIESDSFLEY